MANINSNKFVNWLDTFISEKNINIEESFSFTTENDRYFMEYGVVINAIKTAPKHEQSVIRDMIVRIDFVNGSVRDYLQHLGKALVSMTTKRVN